MAIASSFRLQGIQTEEGRNALNTALALARAENAPDTLTLAEVFREIGDWNTAFGAADSNPNAGAEYRRAWELLGALPNGEELRREWFSGATYVLRAPLSLANTSARSRATRGTVTVKFDIDTVGRATNAEIIESNPPGLKDDDVLRHVYRSRFRPAMRDGEVVPGRRAIRYPYAYDPESITLPGAQTRN